MCQLCLWASGSAHRGFVVGPTTDELCEVMSTLTLAFLKNLHVLICKMGLTVALHRGLPFAFSELSLFQVFSTMPGLG